MKITQERIKEARQTNLVTYLTTHGIALKREGNQYFVVKHDSIRVKGNMYYQHSTQIGGNAVDYLIKVEGYTFERAVDELASGNYRGEEEEMNCRPPTKPFQWDDIVTTTDYRRGIAYLTQTRKIDYKTVVKPLIARGSIYQEVEHSNLLFPITDEHGVICGAEVQGTFSQKRFKGVKTGSNARLNGFKVKIDIEKTKYTLFFESAVELLSFLDIELSKGKTLKGCMLVSMAGVKPDLIKHISTAEQSAVVVCTNNDTAGQWVFDEIKLWCPSAIELKPEPQYNDWNDQLRAMKGNNGI